MIPAEHQLIEIETNERARQVVIKVNKSGIRNEVMSSDTEKEFNLMDMQRSR